MNYDCFTCESQGLFSYLNFTNILLYTAGILTAAKFFMTNYQNKIDDVTEKACSSRKEKGFAIKDGVYLPYNEDVAHVMEDYSFNLIVETENGEKCIDITHEAGIPYLLTAKQLGGKKIVVYSRLDEDESVTFEENEVPNFASKITDVDETEYFEISDTDAE